jgi:hypothetical protein
MHLLRDAPVPVRIVMIGPRTRPGVANGADDPIHLLDACANGMGALPDGPDRFASRIRQRPGADGNSFSRARSGIWTSRGW